MGVKALRDAFDAAADGRLTCQTAFLDYVRQDGTEWQKLTFSGIDSAGAAFSVESALLPPKTDLTEAAGDVARDLLKPKAATS
jgi:hypothetical protein